MGRPAEGEEFPSPLCSFDVFDTCLVRTCVEPGYVHLLLARQILGAGAEPTRIAEFVRCRQGAEAEALAESRSEDVDLRAIYAKLRGEWPEGTAREFLQAEIELERSLLRPVASVLQILRGHRVEGRRIAFISDMYLPGSFLREVLADHGFFEPGDLLYVSGEVGKRKSTGSLFAHVRDRDGVDVRTWIHYGDHPESDGRIPKSLGIDARQVPFPPVSRYGKALLGRPRALMPQLDAARCAGIARAVRLGYPRLDGLPLVATEIVAPMLVFFVASVLKDARKRGLEHLFFLARDGKILHEIAEILMGQREDALRTSYLHLSRRTLYFPCVGDASRREMEEIFHAAFTRSPRQNFLSLNIPEGVFFRHCAKAGISPEFFEYPLDPVGMERLFGFLERDDVREELREESLRQRVLLLEYFTQEGLLHSGAAIVDSGWGLTSQKLLNRMLKRERQATVFGYYLCVLERRKSLDEVGGFFAGFIPELETSTKRKDAIRDAQILIEQIFLATRLGSTIGLERSSGRIAPVLGPSEHAGDGSMWIDGIRAAVLEWAREVANVPELLESSEVWMQEMGWTGLETLWRTPCPQELSWMDESTYSGIGACLGDDSSFVRRIPVGEFLQAMFLPHRSVRVGWLRGSLVLSYGRIGAHVIGLGLRISGGIKNRLRKFR